jgi:phosphoglycerate dehydrogenase-like enzyme
MNANPLVLVITDEDSPQFSMLAGVECVIGKTVEDFAEAAPRASAILYWSGSREQLRSVLLIAPNVKWVHSRAAGLDATLFPELVESAVILTNAKGVFSEALGEFALAAILYFAKDLRRMIRNQEAGRWEIFLVDEIAGQTLGIIGYGSIGQAAAKRAKAMGMKILALRNRATTTDTIVDRFFERDEMEKMLGECDYVLAATPLTPETHHVISDSVFAAMKPACVFINLGRGPVVDQAALVRALQEKRIKGAALDVFEQEPVPEGDPVYKLDNLLLSPHTADRTKSWLDDSMRFFVAQYERFKNGEPLKNVVNKKQGY